MYSVAAKGQREVATLLELTIYILTSCVDVDSAISALTYLIAQRKEVEKKTKMFYDLLFFSVFNDLLFFSL